MGDPIPMAEAEAAAQTLTPHILFVDDDPLVLQGLRRMLHPMRDIWRCEFCEGGPEAVSRIEGNGAPFDVIVSDMRMPVMNGAEVLSRAAKAHPATARVVLSGHADRDLIMQSVGVAHRYLAKPCDARLLLATLHQALGIRSMLRSEELRRATSGTIFLPARPDLCVRLLSVIQSSDTAIGQVEEIVSRDPAMAATLLKLVNSAFFGIPAAAHGLGLREAISFLGLDVLRSLVLTVGLFDQLKAVPGGLPPSEVEAVWTHSFEVAQAARAIAEAEEAGRSLAEEAFIAGLLHDVGKLFLAPVQAQGEGDGDAPAPRKPLVPRAGETVADVERRLYGATHGEAGGYLFGLWGLPAGVVEAVAFHHEPRRGSLESYGPGSLSPLTAVHAADVLVHRKRKDAHHPSLLLPDDAHLAQAGVGDRLDAWERLV